MRLPRTAAAVAATAIGALVVSLLPVAAAAGPAQVPGAAAMPSAVSASQWRAGNIISDAAFYAANAMTAAQIQTFLNAQGASCVAGEQPCLKDYRMTTPSRPAETNLCAAYTPATNETAAQIIAKVGQACGINPQVLLVLLQKETSLVTKSRPTTSNYDRATGFGCPDTGPGGTANCNTQYYGFFNQLYRAARQYLVYRNNPTRYAYQAGRVNSILYHPNTACGTEQVYIENQATAGLYIYTPYVPNAAALANFAGTGDSCSSYGNRNFFRLYSQWFGDQRVGPLVRAQGTSSAYLLDNGGKRPVRDPALLAELVSRLGPVAEISSQALATYPALGEMQRVVRHAGTGQILWLSQARLHWFPTCAAVEAWTGVGCGSAYVNVDASTLDRLPSGPDIPAIPGVSGTTPNVVAKAHTAVHGWMSSWAVQGQTIGTTGKSLRLEAVSANYVGSPGSGIECRAHVAGHGWMGWVGEGATCGTANQGRQLEAVQLRLTGPDAATHKIWYRAHVAERGWLGWTSSGGTAGTTGYGLRAEALQVLVLPASAPSPGSTSLARYERAVEYRAHAAQLGWMAPVRSGIAGTTGQWRRIEAITVGFPDAQPWSGGLECSANVQTREWLGWVPNGATCGTTLQWLQLEGVRLRLTGQLATKLDVWYRVHSAYTGWSGWASNGEPAGTTGFSYRAEAVEIRYLPKGTAAPGPTANAYRVG